MRYYFEGVLSNGYIQPNSSSNSTAIDDYTDGFPRESPVLAVQREYVRCEDSHVKQQAHGSANSSMLNASGAGVTMAARMKINRMA